MINRPLLIDDIVDILHPGIKTKSYYNLNPGTLSFASLSFRREERGEFLGSRMVMLFKLLLFMFLGFNKQANRQIYSFVPRILALSGSKA